MTIVLKVKFYVVILINNCKYYLDFYENFNDNNLPFKLRYKQFFI